MITKMNIINIFNNLIKKDEKELYSLLAVLTPIVLCKHHFPNNFPDNELVSLISVLFYMILFLVIYKIPINKKLCINKKMVNNVIVPLINTKSQFEEVKFSLVNLKNSFVDESTNSDSFKYFYKYLIQKIDGKINQTARLIKELDEISEKYNNLDPEEVYKQTVEKNHRMMVYLLFITSFVFWVLKILPFSSEFNIFIIYNIMGFIFLFFLFILVLIVAYYISYVKYKFAKSIMLYLIPIGMYFLNFSLKKRKDQT
ncbi:hypothetical protein [Methanococcoides sp. LMO-2]|uniref:Type II secretion system protein GspF domain-containing protein n=1 Tax=Methanococcoides cohabitans TaxID=3136559 RepID=A0ABU9KPV0_9EURY